MYPFATHPAHAVFHEVFVVVTSIHLLLQAYTIYMTLRVARSELNEYRYLMMMSTTCDICLAVTLGFIVQPHVHAPFFSCISARGLASMFGHEGARIAMILVYTFGVALVASRAYCMSYRVTAVLPNPSVKRRFLSAPVIATCMLLMAGLIAVVSYAIHTTTMRDTDDNYDGSALANENTCVQLCIDTLFDGRMLASSRAFSADGKIVWKNRDLWNAMLSKMLQTEYITDEEHSIMCFLNPIDRTSRRIHAALSGMYVATELSCASAAFWIIRSVGRLATQSSTARFMHVQLTRLLLLQMLSPFITLLGPVVYLVGGQFGFYRASVGALYTCLAGISVFPMVNAILTITFVGPYRRFTAKWMRAAFKGDFGADTDLQSTAVPTPAEYARRRSTLIDVKGNVRAEVNRHNAIFGHAGNVVYPSP